MQSPDSVGDKNHDRKKKEKKKGKKNFCETTVPLMHRPGLDVILHPGKISLSATPPEVL